jgi:hypothetical protein
LLVFAATGAIARQPVSDAWWPIDARAVLSETASSTSDWPSPPKPARDRWQSWNPIPITAAVSGFWANAPDDVWAWGGKEVMRWDGRAWTRVNAPVKHAIDGIWGAPNDVWLLASEYMPPYKSRDFFRPGYVETSLLHWNGEAWRSVEDRSVTEDDDGRLPSSRRRSVPPPGADRIVSRDELATLWTGHASGRALPDFKAGYRTGRGEIWAAAAGGRQLAHFDGRTWTLGARLASSDFSAVRMFGAGDGWAVSRRPVSYGEFDPHLGGPAGDALFRWDGRAWRFFQPLSERVHALWGTGADDVWAVGDSGLVMHWDGGQWSRWSERLAGNFHAVWGRARDDVWINGCANHFYHWNGTTLSRAPNPVPADYAGVCLGLGGTSAADVSAIGEDLFLRWSGAAWRSEPSPLKGARPLAGGVRIAALWSAPTEGDLWAVGDEGGYPLVLRRRAGRWTKLPTPRTAGYLRAIWEDRDDNVWAVGKEGLILHWDGKSWSQEESGVVEPLSAIHGAGDKVWIVGDRGTVLFRSLRSPESGP